MADRIEQIVERGILHMGNLLPLKEVMRRAKQGKDITIGYIGGSITMGSLASSDKNCYAYLVYSWWCKRFPESKVGYINAGIGGTTSHFGVARVEDDLLYSAPDWVVTEFSVNDTEEEHFNQTYEGLLRKILLSKKDMAVLIVNSVYYNNGKNVQESHNLIAKYYELPVVSMKQGIYEEVLSGRMKKEEITSDDLHPNDMGHQLMAHIIIGYLERVYAVCDKEDGFIQTAKDRMKEPFTPNHFASAMRYQNYNCIYDAQGFVKDNAIQKNICDIFKRGWYGKKKGDRIVFHITASNIAIQYRKSVLQSAPIAYAILDNDEANKVKLDGNFDEDWGDCLYMENVLLYGEKKEHKIEIIIEEVPARCEINFYLVSIIAQ